MYAVAPSHSGEPLATSRDVRVVPVPGGIRRVKERREGEVEMVARLTDWDTADIRAKMTPLPPAYGGDAGTKEGGAEWWKEIWK